MKQVEHAQLAADCQRMNNQDASGYDDHDMGQDLEKHHQILKSQRDAEYIYPYIKAHHGDPAFNISHCVP